jgi:mitochondrial chaperone BCS1
MFYRISNAIPFLHDTWAVFCKMFMENQFLQGMLVPGIISVLSYGIWKLYLQLDTYLRTHLLRSVTIKKEDDNYDTVVAYITKKYVVDSQSFVAETYKQKRKTWKEWRNEFMTGKLEKPRFAFRPSDVSGAISFFKYNGHRIMMTRNKGQTVMVGHDRKPLALEELTLTCWGKDSSVLSSILNEALDEQELEENDELSIWVRAEHSWIGGWEKALSKKPRAKESVILDHDLADTLIKDAEKFQNSVDWYNERGIPYRRGYILHGPPGTGVEV